MAALRRGGVGPREGSVGDDAGIGAVVLGQPAAGLGEQADALGVQAHDLDAWGLQAVDEGGLVAARGFEGEALDAVLGEPGGELGVALGGVGNAQRVVERPERAVEPKLAAINAGGGCCACHPRIPSLQSGLGDLATARADEDAGRAPSSPSGWTQRRQRAPPRRAGVGATTPALRLCGTDQSCKGRGEGGWRGLSLPTRNGTCSPPGLSVALAASLTPALSRGEREQQAKPG